MSGRDEDGQGTSTGKGTPSGEFVDWWVYILRCADGSLYTGITNRLEARLQAHAEGRGAKYTRSRLPIELVFKESRPDRSAALRREAEIKTYSRADKKALIAAIASGDTQHSEDRRP